MATALRTPGSFDACMATPFAVLGVRIADGGLAGIEYLPLDTSKLEPVAPLAREVCRQIGCYLGDSRFEFHLPLLPGGTPFQRRVWARLQRIAPGTTMTYGEIARELGTAARPVGGACGDNPIPLIVPCHRVLAASGPGGFMHARDGWPLRIKAWLLRHEGIGH